MPNWCSNHAIFTHKDPSQVEKVLAAVKEEKLFETFFPFPNGEWDYGWCVENWGTKWEANILDPGYVELEDFDGQKGVSIPFDTAWGPPTGFYDKMTDLGFGVDATYYEEGMQFAGRYTSDKGDYSVEYNFEDPDWRENIEDDKVMDLVEGLYDSWLDYQESLELEEEDGDDTDEKRD